jgi:predicted DNA binding protein
LKEAVIHVAKKGEPMCHVVRGSSGQASVKDVRISGDARGFYHLVELRSTRTNVSRVIKELRRTEGIREVDVAYVGRGRAVALIANDGCPMCRTAYGSGCFISSASSRASGGVEWRVILRRGQSVKPLLDGFASVGLDSRVAEVREVESANRTTSRQEEVLLASLAAGYFDYPRRVGVKKLAKLFGVAPSTLSETIRRGERNVLDEYLTSLTKA